MRRAAGPRNPLLKRRALEGYHPKDPQGIEIIAWLEATARGWNADPTPFMWHGKRATRRARSHARRLQAVDQAPAPPVGTPPQTGGPGRATCETSDPLV